MELARTERSYQLQRQKKTLNKMLDNLAKFDTKRQNMFSLPSQSIFHKKQPSILSENEWKLRCQKQFHILLRSQEDNHLNESLCNNNTEFTPIHQLVQTKSIKVRNDHIKSITAEDVVALFWQIGEKCKQCIQFDFSNASKVKYNSIRSLLLTESFGRHLIILRAMNQPAINDQTLALFASRCYSLKVIDFSYCINVMDCGLKTLMESTGYQMDAISLKGCKKITGYTLLLISKTCKHLNLLDISKCPKVHDVGWLAFGNQINKKIENDKHRTKKHRKEKHRNDENNYKRIGSNNKLLVIKNLKYLNLQSIGNNNCNDDPSQQDTHKKRRYQTTEKSLIYSFISHVYIKVLNISNNSTIITNKSLKCIGKYMINILSLNISYNKLISDKGIHSIALGCTKIQAINMTALGKLTTPGIYLLLQLRSNSIKLVNLNGLQGNLPVSLLPSLKKHLPYCDIATSFYGFKPIDNVVHKKLIDQWNFIENAAAAMLQAGIRGCYDRVKVRLLKNVMTNRIQLCWYRYKAYKEYNNRVIEITNEKIASKKLVHWMRIILERIHNKKNIIKRNKLQKLFLLMKKSSTKISSVYRGYYYRTNSRSPIADIILWMKGRDLRIKKSKAINAVITLQRHYRRYAFREFYNIDLLEKEQRKIDCFYAVRILQQSIRMFNAKMKLHYLWDAWNKENWRIYNACVTIQCMVRKHQALKLLNYLRWKRREGIKKKHRHAAIIQGGLYRSILGRKHGQELYYKRRNAAIKIQSYVRMNQVGHWSTMSPDLLYEKWKLKSEYEMMYALQTSTQKKKKLQMKYVEGHSASESDEEWEPVWDDVNDCQMYFSAKRNATRRDPSTLRKWERSLVGKKVMIYDEWDEKRWVHAAIKKYNSWKNKWKVIFAGKDGDYRWIDVKARHDLFMMRSSDFIENRDGEIIDKSGGDWCMLRFLFPGKRDPLDL
jgi:hypothetical protein